MNGYGRGEDNRSKSGGSVVTRETFGMTLLLFSVLLFVFSIAGSYILGEIGVAITSFLYGVFGYFLYPFLALCIYTSFVMITGKKWISGVWLARFFSVAASIFLIAHLASSSRFFGNGFSAYMNGCWKAAESSASGATAGGVLFGLAVYPLRAILTLPGAYIACSLLIVLSAFFVLWGTPVKRLFQARERNSRRTRNDTKERELEFEDLPTRKKASDAVNSENEEPYAVSRFRGTLESDQGSPRKPSERSPKADPSLFASPKNSSSTAQNPNYASHVSDSIPSQKPYIGTQDPNFARNLKGSIPSQNPYAGAQNPNFPGSIPQQFPYAGVQDPNFARNVKNSMPSQNLYPNAQTSEQTSDLKDQSLNWNRFDRPLEQTQPRELFRDGRILPHKDPPMFTRDELTDRYGIHPQAQAPNREWDSRAILFSPDPAKDYYRNLAYNGDYNRQRKSSVHPVEPKRIDERNEVFPSPSAKSYNLSGSLPTYSESFHREAEQARQYKPRNIIQQKPERRNEGYSIRPEDLTYNKIPSFKNRDFSLPVEDFKSQTADEPKNDRFEDSRSELFDEPKNGRFADSRRELFEEPKNNRFADSRSELFDEPKNDRFAEPRRELFEEPKNDRFAESRSELFDEPKNDRFADSRSELFDEPKNDRFAESRSELFEEPKNDRFADSRSELFDEPKNDRFADSRRELFDESKKGIEESNLFDEPEDSSTLPNLLPDREERNVTERGKRSSSKSQVDQNAVEHAVGQMGFGEGMESRALGGISRSSAELFDNDELEDESDPIQVKADSKSEKKKRVPQVYVKPSLDLLKKYDDRIAVSQEEIDRNSSIIIDTLAGFRVDAEIMNVTCGPSVTRYDIDIPRNIASSAVIKRSGEIAMRLHARDGVNMYANNEAGMISIEVPNAVRAIVGLSSILQSEQFNREKEGSLIFAMGKDIEGRNVCGDIFKMKHLLVAGATGSGKSVCLNSMLISLLFKYSPQELRLILIDPKKVEFALYDGLPHLMINEIISEPQKAVMALNWAVKEMERRYELFEQKTRSGTAVREIDEYNRNLEDGEEKLPKIVIVVDELADFMLVAKKDMEERIQRLTQKSRAAGIHLVLATQRPSVNVITGVIKGNLPTRIGFRVIQEVDSRTILDDSGAEKLLGNGDMLYKTEGVREMCRLQGAFLSSQEVQAVIENIKQNNESYFDSELSDYINRTESEDGGAETEFSEDRSSCDDDPLFIKSLAIAVKLGSASISLIQRKCGVGYNHAGKIMEWMEDKGFVSPFDGKAKARTVLLTKEEFESRYGPLD